MRKSYLSILFIGIYALILTSCTEEENADDKKNHAPTASFSVSPQSGNLSTVFNFDASASTDEEEATAELMIRWDWEDDSEWDTEFSTTKTAQHQYNSTGDFTVVLEVKDNEGWTDKETKTITVSESGDLSFTTGSSSEITTTSAKIIGTINSIGDKEIMQHGHCWSFFVDPEVGDHKTELGATGSTGSFESDLSDLIETTTYYVRAYVITSEGTFYGDHINFNTASSGNGSPCPVAETVTDEDGNVYHTLVVDGKCWLKENLNTGVMISSAGNQSDNGSIEKYCYNDEEKYCDVFGGLYQWDELMDYANSNPNQGICPDGWRLPTLNELKSFETSFGNGYDLLLQGISTSASNASGFSSYVSGYKSYLPNEFTGFNSESRYWSGEEYPLSTDQAYSLSLDNGGVIGYPTKNKQSAYSVRCIKDQ